jgi:hypothetical protein
MEADKFRLPKLRETVECLVDQAAPMAEIERFLSQARLPEEQTATLWLYAHALVRRRPRETEPLPPVPRLTLQS